MEYKEKYQRVFHETGEEYKYKKKNIISYYLNLEEQVNFSSLKVPFFVFIEIEAIYKVDDY